MELEITTVKRIKVITPNNEKIIWVDYILFIRIISGANRWSECSGKVG